MNETATRFALGLSFIAISGLLITNKIQRDQLNTYEKEYKKLRTWARLASKIMTADAKEHGGVRMDPKDITEIEAYIIMSQNDML